MGQWGTLTLQSGSANCNFNVGSNETINVNGLYNTVTLSANDTVNVGIGATSNLATIDGNNASDVVNINAGTSILTINGAGGSIVAASPTFLLYTSNQTINLAANVASATIFGSYNTIVRTSDSSVITTNGTGNQILDGDNDLDDGGAFDGNDPVIFNLAGGPAATTSAETSPVFFDTANDGTLRATGWDTIGEALLTYDPGPGGTIHQESQLVPGVSALAAIDTNGDGILNAADSGWNNLRLWINTGLGAEFSASDLHTLNEAGIASINLSSQPANRYDNGNVILADGTFTLTGGGTGRLAGVGFGSGLIT